MQKEIWLALANKKEKYYLKRSNKLCSKNINAKTYCYFHKSF